MPWLRSLRVRLASVVVLAALTGCDRIPPRPDDYRLDLTRDEPVSNVDSTFFVYAGNNARDFTLSLKIGKLVANSSVEVRDGENGLIQTITSNGDITTNRIDGNVARIRVIVPSAWEAPDVVLHSINRNFRGDPPEPVSTGVLRNTVSSFPLRLGKPVDFEIQDSLVEKYHFTARGLAATGFDVVFIGAARMGIHALRDRRAVFNLEPGLHGSDSFTPTRDGDGRLPHSVVARFRPGTDSIAITISNEDLGRYVNIRDETHARIVVLPRLPAVPLAFPASTPILYWLFPIGIDHDGSASSGLGASLAARASCTDFAGRPGFPNCYDGHEGNDYLTNPPGTGLVDINVNAAAPGIVVDIDDGHVDTCGPVATSTGITVACPGPGPPAFDANFVVVRHVDGTMARYYHLKKGSVSVAPGDRVACLQRLGFVGSSGISATPHLHFQLDTIATSRTDANPYFSRVDELLGFATTVDPYPSLWRRTTPTPWGPVPANACS